MEAEGDISETSFDLGSQATHAGSDEAIRCVTVRQLLEATQTHSSSPFKIDGNELGKVIIVANLCFLSVGQTYTDFGLDDGTGRIKARQRNLNSDAPDDIFDARDFPYIRVIGKLTQFKGKNSIEIVDIRKVSSPYEPYYHILHTICDSLMYERGPPPFPGESSLSNKAENGAAAEEMDAQGHNAPVISPPLASVDPTAGTVKNDTRADFIAQPVKANADKGKAPISAQKLSSASGSSPASPKHYRHVEDRGMPEHPGVAQPHNLVTPGRPCNEANSATSDVPPRSVPSQSTIPTKQHIRRFTPTDPYSRLSSLQRDVILCIKAIAAQNPEPPLYPIPEYNPPWEGVHLSVIVNSLKTRRSDLSLQELTDCIDGLLDEGYIYTIDDEHYNCT